MSLLSEIQFFFWNKIPNATIIHMIGDLLEVYGVHSPPKLISSILSSHPSFMISTYNFNWCFRLFSLFCTDSIPVVLEIIFTLFQFFICFHFQVFRILDQSIFSCASIFLVLRFFRLIRAPEDKSAQNVLAPKYKGNQYWLVTVWGLLLIIRLIDNRNSLPLILLRQSVQQINDQLRRNLDKNA